MRRIATHFERGSGRPRGFTLVELLVVIGIIALLIGLAAPAFFAIRKGAKVTASETTLRAIANGIEQFKNDFGYLPPLVLDDPLIGPDSPDWCTSVLSRDDASDRLRAERYHSIYSLPVYLLGVGALNPDRSVTNEDLDDGVAGPGFRDPGSDRAWGGARVRTPETHRVLTSGRVYRPYVEIADTDRVRGASAFSFDFPEDRSVTVSETGPWDGMYVILDDWGTPIRYYRNWPTRATGQTNRSLLEAPAEIVLPDALRDAPADGMEFDGTRDPELMRAEYVLLSAGPDRVFSPEGFAVQGAGVMGSVADFLADSEARPALLRSGFADNLRLAQ